MSIPGSASPLLFASVAAEAAAFQIDRSLRFNSGDSAYLNRTPSSAGNRRTWTWSGWVKRSALSSTGGYMLFQGGNADWSDDSFRFDSDQIGLFFHNGTNAVAGQFKTEARFRDISAWYHIVVAFDTTNATAADRMRLYVNGDQITDFATNITLPQNFESNSINDAAPHFIGTSRGTSGFFDGYLAEIHFIDGQALDPTDFGEYDDNNVWQAKEVSITSPNDGTVWSSALTSSGTFYTGAQGVQSGFDGDTSTYVQNQLSASAPNSITFTPSGGITHASSVEVYLINAQNTVSYNGGSAQTLSANAWQTVASGSGTLTSLVFERNSTSGASFAAIRVDGVILVDGANEFGTNGFHLDFSDTSDLGADAAGSNDWTPNNLSGTAPGLSTANQGFDVVTYTGNGSTQTISGLAFQPDLVWIKSRSNAVSGPLFDSVRGVNKGLFSSGTNAEFNDSSTLKQFNSDGFQLGGNTHTNANNYTYVAWCWKAGGTPSSNTDGTITSSVSASTTYGFSVVSYTGNNTSGATVGHGLSSVPKWIVIKSRDQSGQYWHVYHSALDADEYIYLNVTNAKTSGNDFMNGTRPTSSVFSLGNGNACNKSSDDVIAYCWSEVSGFSKFGSYTGNGSSTGPTVTTGFKPRFLLIKNTNNTDGWSMWDSARNPSNPVTLKIEPNSSGAEGSNSVHEINFLDDGFQILGTWNGHNGSGNTMIYAAFAAKPDESFIDSLIDTPTNYEASSGNNGGNYATLNPLQKSSGSTLSNGNLDISMSSAQGTTFATMAFPASGKYYFECTSDATECDIGIAKADADLSQYLGKNSSGYGYYKDGNVYNNDSSAGSGASYGSGDIIGVAFDADAGTCKWYKNNVLQVTISSLSGEWFPAFGAGSAAGIFNFGQRPFSYTPPTGFLSLCTTNLTDPTIADGSTAFDTKIYTGNGSSQTISNFLFSPDFAWFKNRATNKDPRITDTIRGTGVELYPSSTSGDYSQPQGVTAFNSDGVSVGSDGGYNGSGQGMVLWAWDGGTSTVSNTDGSITSQVRANPSAGFSIATYLGDGSGTANTDSGDSFGHGLNAAPDLVICKKRSGVNGWPVYHSATALGALNLSSTGALDTGSYLFAQQHPSSSVVYLGNNPEINKTGDTYVAYCFASVAGYSAFGSYTGNGSSDGPFVQTNFRVAWLMTKRTDTAENWEIRDSTRNPHNRTNLTLFPHSASAEDTGSVDFDFLSNGFKVRNTNGSTNANGGTYIYMAFAEHPFKTARAR